MKWGLAFEIEIFEWRRAHKGRFKQTKNSCIPEKSYNLEKTDMVKKIATKEVNMGNRDFWWGRARVGILKPKKNLNNREVLEA